MAGEGVAHKLLRKYLIFDKATSKIYKHTYLFRTGLSPARDKMFIRKKIHGNVCGLAAAFLLRWFHRHIPGMPRYVLAFRHLRQPCA